MTMTLWMMMFMWKMMCYMIVMEEGTQNVGEDGDATVDPALDQHHKVQRQVMEALDHGDALYEEVGDRVDIIDDDDIEEYIMDKLEELYE